MNIFKKLVIITFLILGSNALSDDVEINHIVYGEEENDLQDSNLDSDFGQTFTATKTGVLKSIAVAHNDQGTGDYTLKIYEGEGNTGNLLHTQTGSKLPDTYTAPNTYTFTTITIDGQVDITNGAKYTFHFTPEGALDILYELVDADDYAGGDMFCVDYGGILTDYDMVFKIVQGDTPSSNELPTISNATANQTVDDNVTISPFSGITLADDDDDDISLTITLDDDSKGSLSATSIASGTVADVQASLRAIVFTPTENSVVVGDTQTTTFTITTNDGTDDSTANTDTTVVSTSINDIPTNMALSSASINQSEGTNGIVGAISTTDADTGESFSYGLVSGTDDTNNDLFNISGSNLRADDASALAAGTYKIRLNTNDGDSNFEKAFTITVVDDVNPTLSTLSPADNATDISRTANLIITLSETVVKGTGDILIKKVSDGSTIETIDVTSGLVSISGGVITIDPSVTLDLNTEFNIERPLHSNTLK